MNALLVGFKNGALTRELKVFGWMAAVFVLAYFLPLSNPKITAAI